MGCWDYASLKAHVGHKVVVVGYEVAHEYEGDPENVSVECETCGEVILDYDKTDPSEEIRECKECGSLGSQDCAPDCKTLVEEVSVTLKLTRSEWCELANALTSKAINVEKGDYDKDDDDDVDTEAWATELRGAYTKVAEELTKAKVVY